MEIQDHPTREDLVSYESESTAYRSAEQNVEHAVSLLYAHESWFADHRAENLEES